ncbi:NAD(P)H-binding protein [Arthrobacter sp. ATA002]|uniref:NmrA family NAD(P)-binding protein n=1 Tax=Arthrobacter sp. ATA002 TaxID=2991715 RepID=UPI0022A6C510|nr:NmrA family NAD(P)-binding protein [Arthrobacter sp. ATA002]WAP53046.1 NAD(P)H-binding protein [Arthrobacter sp. ATA002]
MTVLVTGATGTVGHYLVDHLLALGVTVRCLTRTPEKASFPGGVEVVRGDLGAPESLDEAFDGVSSAHLITFAGEDYAPIPDGSAVVGKLLAAGVSRVSLLKGDSSASLVEEAVFASSLRWTVLAPVEFMANMLEWTDGVRKGRLEEGFVDVPSTVVHESDIAKVAARVLVHGGYDNETLWITGPEALTVRERVAVIEQVTGRAVALTELPAAALEAQWTAYGFSADDVSFMLQMKTNPPEASRIPRDTVRRVTGHQPLSFREWVQEHAGVFSNNQPGSRGLPRR